MAKALKVVGTIAVVAGLAIVTGGAALGLGVSLGTSIAGIGISAGTLLLTGTLISTAGSLLSPKPKSPTVNSATRERLNLSAELRTPRTMVFGTTAATCDLRLAVATLGNPNG